MSNIDIWYYAGECNMIGKELELRQKYSSFLPDVKHYDDMNFSRNNLDLLHESATRNVFEIQRWPKCGKKSTKYPNYLTRIMKWGLIRSI